MNKKKLNHLSQYTYTYLYIHYICIWTIYVHVYLGHICRKIFPRASISLLFFVFCFRRMHSVYCTLNTDIPIINTHTDESRRLNDRVYIFVDLSSQDMRYLPVLFGSTDVNGKLVNPIYLYNKTYNKYMLYVSHTFSFALTCREKFDRFFYFMKKHFLSSLKRSIQLNSNLWFQIFVFTILRNLSYYFYYTWLNFVFGIYCLK